MFQPVCSVRFRPFQKYLVMKRNTLLLILILSIFSTSHSNSQDIEWNRVSYGFSISYLQSEKNVDTFWNNTIEVGGELQYRLSDQLFIGSGIHLAYFKSETGMSVPNFYYLSIPIELKFLIPLETKIKLFTAGGIQSNTFAFRGKGAEVLGDNDIESEFGVFLVLGIRTTFWDLDGFEIYSKYQTIFTSPESTEFINIGTRFFF